MNKKKEEIEMVENFGDIYKLLQTINLSDLWNSFSVLIVLLMLLIVLFVAIAVIVWIYRFLVKWIGPPYKKVEPETLVYTRILGQVLPLYIENSKVFYSNIFGDLIKRGPLRRITAWFHLGAYRFLIFPPWPLAYFDPDEQPLDIRQFLLKVIVDSANLKDFTLARTVTLQLTCWIANPYHVFFGRTPVESGKAFVGRVIGEVANILRGLEESEVDEKSYLQNVVDSALLSRRLWNWFRNRPVDAITRDTGIGTNNIVIENIEPPLPYMKAAATKRLLKVYYDFVEKTRGFTKDQFDLLQASILSGGDPEHGSGVEVMTKIGGGRD
ncbi:MAG: hypothetical protein WCX69_02930 [Candidatus Paceibacterota bacterium]